MRRMRVPSLTESVQYSPVSYCPMSPKEEAALLSDPLVVHFDEEVVLARHYAAQLFNQADESQAFTSREVRLAEELMERLEQVNFLCKTVAVLTRRYISRQGREAPIAEQRDIWFLIYLYAESFYYFAHRVQDILREDKPGRLPLVTGFEPCK